MIVIAIASQDLTAETLGIINDAGVPILVDSSTSLLPVPISNVTIGGVAINSSGISVVGGQNAALQNWAGLISPSGQVTPFTNNGTTAPTSSVAINASGNSLAGVISMLAGNAKVRVDVADPMGNAVLLTTDTCAGSQKGSVNSGAINNLGLIVIGGAAGQNATDGLYIATISPGSQTINPVFCLVAPPFSVIESVSLNESSNAIAGGFLNNTPYAAVFNASSPSPSVTQVAIPFAQGSINSVSIDSAGIALIGGTNTLSGSPYAALVTPEGQLQALSGDPLPSMGAINSVARNNCGYGIIGGSEPNAAYAAYVDASGNVTQIPSLPTGGGAVIDSVSINAWGTALIGGTPDGVHGYAAIVYPGGTVIPLQVGSFSEINPVSIRNVIPSNDLEGNNRVFAQYINDFAPEKACLFIPSIIAGEFAEALESAAPTRNALSVFAANENLFYLNQSLSLHLRHNPFKKSKPPSATPSVSSRTSESRFFIAQNLELATDAPDAPVQEETEDSQAKEEFATDLPRFSTGSELPWTIWFEGIGIYASQKEQHQTVGFQPYGGGAILATDKNVTEDIKIGGGVAYTYTHVREDEDSGHSNINQEFCFVYTSWNYYGMHLDGGLWFGSFQTNQVRNIHMTAFDFKSTSHPWGLQFSPHVELGYYTPIMHAASGNAEFVIDPFFMLDWINSWQDRFQEKGNGPFNADQKANYSSFLRSEIGYRVYEAFTFSSWRLILEEKLSYVNKTPFVVGKINAFLVGSPGSFTVETLTSSQNLGAAQMSFIFEPFDLKYPLGSFFYQGEFNGSSFQSHQFSLEASWEF